MPADVVAGGDVDDCAQCARVEPQLQLLEDIGALEGLGRLTKLSVIGSRLKGTKAVVRTLQRIPQVEVLDLRDVNFYFF
jgi:hypothetical protein